MKVPGNVPIIITILLCGAVIILSSILGAEYYHRGCRRDNCTYIADGELWKIVVNGTVICTMELSFTPKNFTLCYDDGFLVPYCPRFNRCDNKGLKIGVIIIDVVCGAVILGLILIIVVSCFQIPRSGYQQVL